MKKIPITIVLLFLLLGNCIIINSTGLNYERVKGDEVKNRIQAAAIYGDFVFYILHGIDKDNPNHFSYTSLLGPIFMKIDENKYYIEYHVRDCESAIRWYPIRYDGTPYSGSRDATTFGNTTCFFEPDGYIFSDSAEKKLFNK